MPETQIIDWLQENSYRSYPLQTATNRIAGSGYLLGDEVLVDALLSYTTVSMALISIVADSSNVVFNISGGVTFTFSRSGSFPNYNRLTNGSLLVVNSLINIPNGTHSFTNVYFEKSVCIEFGAEWLGVTSVTFDSSASLTGVITLKEGYQFGITTTISTLNFTADSSNGTPLGCLSQGGADECGDIVSFVNGIGPVNNILKFSRGNDMIILEDPANYRIFIGLAFDPSDVCKTIPINPEI